MGPDQKIVTKLLSKWSPGIIWGAFCTIFRALPVGTGLGARFGWKLAKKQIQIIIFDYLFLAQVGNPSVKKPGLIQASGAGGSGGARRRRPESCRASGSVGHARELPSLRICNDNQNLYLVLTGFRPNLAPRPVPTGRARQMVQHTPQIIPVGQF